MSSIDIVDKPTPDFEPHLSDASISVDFARSSSLSCGIETQVLIIPLILDIIMQLDAMA